MRKRNGTTLIEMMAAIAILAFVALAVIMSLVSIQQAWIKQKSGIELFNNVRWAMGSIAYEVKQALSATVARETTAGVDGIRFQTPYVGGGSGNIFYWRGNGGGYGNSARIFRGVGVDLASASASGKELANLVINNASANPVFSVDASSANLVTIEITMQKGSRFCALRSKARPRN